jgi:protein TonB
VPCIGRGGLLLRTRLNINIFLAIVFKCLSNSRRREAVTPAEIHEEGMKPANAVTRPWLQLIELDGEAPRYPGFQNSGKTGKTHVLNIGTMALWMTVIPACLAGWLLTHSARRDLPSPAQTHLPETLEIAMSERFGSTDAPATEDHETASTEQEAPEETIPAIQEVAPPEMPTTQTWSPLPTVPDLPAPAAEARPKAETGNRPPSPAVKKPARGGSPEGRSSGQRTINAATSISPTRRLGGGSMPKPNYPAAARSRGQTGTVVVEFIVGENGRVVSARAKSPSPWPLLNEAAVKAVRGWRFPPGGVNTYTRPIIFHLN